MNWIEEAKCEVKTVGEYKGNWLKASFEKPSFRAHLKSVSSLPGITTDSREAHIRR